MPKAKPLDHIDDCGRKTAMKETLILSSEKSLYVADFINLVCDMREAQKQYFKTRSKADLINSKQLEARVDKALQYFLGKSGEGVSQSIISQQ